MMERFPASSPFPRISRSYDWLKKLNRPRCVIPNMCVLVVCVEALFFQFCQLQQEALDFFGIEEAKMMVGKTFEIGLTCSNEQLLGWWWWQKGTVVGKTIKSLQNMIVRKTSIYYNLIARWTINISAFSQSIIMIVRNTSWWTRRPGRSITPTTLSETSTSSRGQTRCSIPYNTILNYYYALLYNTTL